MFCVVKREKHEIQANDEKTHMKQSLCVCFFKLLRILSNCCLVCNAIFLNGNLRKCRIFFVLLSNFDMLGSICSRVSNTILLNGEI